MPRDITLLLIAAVLGGGATLVAMAAPLRFPAAPSWVWHQAFWLGILVCVLMFGDIAVLTFFKSIRLGTWLLATAGVLLLGWSVIHQLGPKQSLTVRPDRIGDDLKSGESITLLDLFEGDFTSGSSYRFEEGMTTDLYEGRNSIGTVTFTVGFNGDFASNSMFMSLFVPSDRNSEKFLATFSTSYKDYLSDIGKIMHVFPQTTDGSQPTSASLKFTGKIYLYHEDIIADADRFALEGLYRAAGLEPVFRGPGYLENRRKNGPPVVKRKEIKDVSGPAILPLFNSHQKDHLLVNLQSLFMEDLKGDGKGIREISFRDVKAESIDHKVTLNCRVVFSLYFNKSMGTIFFIYVPRFQFPFQVVEFAAKEIAETTQQSISRVLAVESAAWVSKVSKPTEVYLYIEDELKGDDLIKAKGLFAAKDLLLVQRSVPYLMGVIADVEEGKIPQPRKHEFIDGLPHAIQ